MGLRRPFWGEPPGRWRSCQDLKLYAAALGPALSKFVELLPSHWILTRQKLGNPYNPMNQFEKKNDHQFHRLRFS